MLEVSDVEYRDNEPYVGVMANTVDRTKTAGLTKRIFVGSSLNEWSRGGVRREGERRYQTPVQDAILDGETVCGCVQFAVGDLEL